MEFCVILWAFRTQYVHEGLHNPGNPDSIIFLGNLLLLNLDFVLVKGKEIDIHVSSEDFFASYMPFI